LADVPDLGSSTLQITSYEDIDFERAGQYPELSLVCAYVIRKALIRKHYLSNTISTWLVKHPESPMSSHFEPCTHIELDFAEFLDEALVDAWDLNESMARNDEIADEADKEWWILKPGMSDGGNGIRLFSSLAELQAIFEQWEQPFDDEEDEANEEDEASQRHVGDREGTTSDTMTSQLRHFIAQPYIQRPLLLESYERRKFHIRAYVLANGALKVYVYREMLALFAARPYKSPNGSDTTMDLAGHLTNTCFQDDSTTATSVYQFWKLEATELPPTWKDNVYDQICQLTGEVFEAAAKEQMVHFQAIPNAFELFGIDFLVDEHLNVFLLELNAYPDFRQTGERLQQVVVGGLFEEVIDVAVAPFFDPSRANAHMGNDRMRLVKNVDLGRR
jgi:tubulin---tyrosine ligase